MLMSNHRNWPQWGQAVEANANSWQGAQPQSLSRAESATGVRECFEELTEFYPCVIFQARPSLEITSVSVSVTHLLGLKIDAVIGRPQFWQERVAPEDWPLFQEMLVELEIRGAVSFVHRIADVLGLPIWFTHSLRKITRQGETCLYGCLVPIQGRSRIFALNPDTVARFIHKLGNHFQLLNLVASSLKKALPDSREHEILDQTLDNAIDLTRIFSDCNQVPSLTSDVQLLEVVKAATGSRASQFAAAGVRLGVNFAEIPEDVTVASDPYLLETALGHILQNALEAISGPGNVQVGGCLVSSGQRGAARIYVRDSGCGIPTRELPQVTVPFFSTKKGHDGLGLTLASRFIDFHGGTLCIRSGEGAGTEVEILLPMERQSDIFSL